MDVLLFYEKKWKYLNCELIYYFLKFSINEKNAIRQNSIKNDKLKKLKENYCTRVKIMILFYCINKLLCEKINQGGRNLC